MKFNTKIKISFLSITVIPVILITVLFVGIFSAQIRNVEKNYGIDNVGIDGLVNQTKIYNKLTQKIYDEIVDVVHKDVQKICDTEYISEKNEELKDKSSFLIVELDEEILFNGAGDLGEEILAKLPEYKLNNNHTLKYNDNSYVYGDYKYLIKEMSFETDDAKAGSIYMITRMEKIIPQVKKMVIEMFVAIIIVVGFTGIALAIWTQKSIMRPLRKITEATKKITEGDLDFTLEKTGNDEFGELCEDFENMRKRLKESTEETIRNEEESKELISNISHDLKTPITAIKGYAEGIIDGVADTPERMEKYIKTIYNKANDMDKLIGELTLYSKIDTNRIPYNFNKVNVDEYFSDCVEEIAVELESKNITLNYFNYVDKNTVIIADPEQLKRVINNIISNSVKYIGNKKGALNIRINDEIDFIHIEIEDNGKGINQKDLPYIFDRFYRTDDSRNSNQGGSGIGLAIVKKIVEVHGGRIWATSKEDTGTIMHFILRKYYEPEVNADYEQDIDN